MGIRNLQKAFFLTSYATIRKVFLNRENENAILSTKILITIDIGWTLSQKT
jgi:hypothetical protein